MSKIKKVEEVLNKIKDNDLVAILGSGGGVCEPTYILKELGKKYLNEKKPEGLTLLHANGIGNRDTYGTDAIAYEGLIKRDIAGHWAMAPKMAELALNEKIEAYNLPQGVISQMYQTIASKKPGVITKIGLNTFIDPRIEGGKMNESAKEDLVKVIDLNDEEWLFYPNMKIDVGIIRGTTADINGNISYEEEAALLDGVSLAQAAKNSGGIVIAQVKYIAQNGTINPKDVVIPGIYVDYIVVDEEQMQTCLDEYIPSLAGNRKVPLETLEPLKLDARKIIARRAAKEIDTGDIINLGVGIPSGIASVAAEEDFIDDITFTIEQGLIGGMPAGGVIFGVSYNAEVMLDQTIQFNFYDGGGLDIAFLGMTQFDKYGNVNSSKTGKLLSGCGGAINISQNAKKVVFCGTFTAKDFKADFNQKLTILNEGSIRKVVEKVDQITFSGDYANKIGQSVLYITERAVFELTQEGIVLIEIAPEIDIENDIIAHMDFVPIISDNIKVFDKELFY